MTALSTPIASVLRGLIRVYQLTVAPLFPASCRFEPSCSRYAAEAIALHGAGRGVWLALRRIARCNPWGGAGYDPVPDPDGRRCCRRHGAA